MQTQDLRSELYPFGLKQKVTDLVHSLELRQTRDHKFLKILEALEFNTRFGAKLEDLTGAFPELRTSIYSYVKTEENPEYTLKLFQCGSSCSLCTKALVNLERSLAESRRSFLDQRIQNP